MPPLTAAEGVLALRQAPRAGYRPRQQHAAPQEAAQPRSPLGKAWKHRLPILVAMVGLKGLL